MTEGELQATLANDLKKGIELITNKPRGSGALTGNGDKRKSQAQGGNASGGNTAGNLSPNKLKLDLNGISNKIMSGPHTTSNNGYKKRISNARNINIPSPLTKGLTDSFNLH